MRHVLFALALMPCWLSVQDASADQTALPKLDDKYHVTNAERAACSEDAVRLCSAAYPDEDALIACMKANRSQLSNACMVAFDAGIHRRHL
jgi:hypothetical protein